MIRITSKRHNFRRCEVAHPKGATEYPDDRFTEADIETLKAEPMLTVTTMVDLPADPENMTVAQLKEELDGKEIPANAKKADLVELVETARAAFAKASAAEKE